MDNPVLQEVLNSWQLWTIGGLIALDWLLGIAAALRTNSFDWGKIAAFYRSNVIPYILGYVAAFVVINFVIPPEGLEALPDDIAAVINVGLVTLAWAAVVATLGNSIIKSVQKLYGGGEETT